MSYRTTLLKKIAAIADELDSYGYRADADALSEIMLKISQAVPSNPLAEGQQQVIDNTGTALMSDGLQSYTNGLDKVLGALGQLASGAGEMLWGQVEGIAGLVTLPVQVATSLEKLLMDAAFAPYVAQIKALSQQNTEIMRELQALLSQGKKEEAKRLIIIKIIPGIKNTRKVAGDLTMILKRKEAGQYKSDTSGFQATIDYAVKNKMTMRQMYDAAMKNQGGNYANNLIAKYKSVSNLPDSALVQPIKLS